MLILDETYRDFHSHNDPIHSLFQQKNWENNFISLYSFSKSYRLTGHRIGAVFTKSERLKQIEKFLDTVTILSKPIRPNRSFVRFEGIIKLAKGRKKKYLIKKTKLSKVLKI